MNRNFTLFFTTLLVTSLLAACGPSEAEITQMTADAATATPEPTPIPYDLTISVTDTDGSPIAGASVAAGGDAVITADDGAAFLGDLASGSLSLEVSAPGYHPLSKTASIERGSNEHTVSLERDPNGLLSQQACGPDEKLIYIEDFQDQSISGWPEIEAGAFGWSIEAGPDNEMDYVLAAREGVNLSNYADDINLTNAVWRVHFRYDGSGWSHMNWRWAPRDVDTRYILALSNGEARLDRMENAHVNLMTVGEPRSNEWHLLEIAYYEDTVTVFLDGEEGASYTEQNPWTEGTFGIEPYPEGDAVFYYDDMSICELSAPLSTIPRMQTGNTLNLTVLDQDGNPVPFSNAHIPDMGFYTDARQVTGDEGTVSWTDVPGGSVTLKVDAPGYVSLEEALEIGAGENQHSVTLDLQPGGLTAANACLPGESILYIEDFQDQTASGWPEIDLGSFGWKIEANPDDAEDYVIAAREGAPLTWFSEEIDLSSAVWRLYLRYDGSGNSHINFRWAPESVDTRYLYATHPGGTSLDRLQGNHVTLRQTGFLRGSEWHLLEMAYYESTISLFLDGKIVATYEEPNAWEGGGLALEPYPVGSAVFYYDDFSVCGLSAAPETIYVAPE